MSEDEIKMLEDEIVKWTWKAKHAMTPCIEAKYWRIVEDMKGLLADGLILDIGLEELLK